MPITFANGQSSNLLAIESKKMKETIEAFLKNLFYFLSSKHTLGLNHFYTFLCVPFLFSIFKTWKKLSRFLDNYCENMPKSRKSRKFLPAKVSALKVFNWKTVLLRTSHENVLVYYSCKIILINARSIISPCKSLHSAL